MTSGISTSIVWAILSLLLIASGGCVEGGSIQEAASDATDTVASWFGGRELTQNEQQYRNDSDDFDSLYRERVLQAAMAGAAVGAAGGALFALGTGGDSGDAVKGAAVGAAVGALAGTVAGHYIAEKQKEYAEEEEMLQSVISDVRAQNEASEKLIDSMRTVLREDKARLSTLRSQRAQGLITEETLRDEVKIIKSNTELARKTVQDGREQLKTFTDISTGLAQTNPELDTSELDAAIVTLRENMDTMTAVQKDLGFAEVS